MVSVEILQQLISRQYNKSEQSLLLRNQYSKNHPNLWVHVLKLRDWSKLRHLQVNHRAANDANIGQLVQIELPALHKLSLSQNAFTDVGMTKIVGLKCPNLRSLDLQCNSRLGSRGLKMLIKIPLPHLQQLRLSQCSIGNEGAKHLVKSQWPHLQTLNISDSHVGIEGCSYSHHLATSQLRWLLTMSGEPEPDRLESESIKACVFVVMESRNLAEQRWIYSGNETTRTIMQEIYGNRILFKKTDQPA